MKKILLFNFLLISLNTSGEYEYGFLHEFYFGRLPSARAEAMGKCYNSIDGDLTTAFFNPAGTATIDGLELSGSLASPFYLLNDAEYSYLSVGYKFSDYFVVGFGRNNFSLGQSISNQNENGELIGYYDEPFYSNYYLTISSQPLKNLYVGINANYFIYHLFNEGSNTFYMDFGCIKKFQFGKNEIKNHSINLGVSIKNLNFAKLERSFIGVNFENELPVITRFGANYQYTLDKHLLIDTLETFNFLFQGDYQLLLNSDYNSGFYTGTEILFLEILALRAGYYFEKEYDFELPEVNYNSISQFTYGFGLQLPIHKLSKIPLNINLDYTTLPQPRFSSDNFFEFENFKSLTMKINWRF